MTSEKTFNGKIRVAARVIDFLSSGLYQNAAACLKELINNCYDADATEVTVSVKPDADLIVVQDNGHGMTRDQFTDHFSNVAESRKRATGQTTPRGRLKIGKIGIGFIAANELCDEMELFSTVHGSNELLHVTIDFGKIRARSYQERAVGGSREVTKGDYEGEILAADTDESYTVVLLKRLRPAAREQFVKSTMTVGERHAPSIYGKTPEQVVEILSGIDSWGALDMYSQTRLHVGLSVPVQYLPGWAPEQYADELRPFTDRASDLGFSVTYDGTPLTKPTVLTDPESRSVLRLVEHEGEYITVHGYLYARHGTLKPRELNGLLLHIREATVGEYDSTWMGFPPQLDVLFKNWTSVELHVGSTGQNPNEDLDDALNIERRTLRETHSATVELRTWFHDQLASFLKDVRGDLHTKPNRARKAEQVEAQKARLDEVTARARTELGPDAGRMVAGAFTKPGRAASGQETLPDTAVAPPDPKALVRQYDALTVYEAVVDAASEVLPRELAQEFLAALARRLA